MNETVKNLTTRTSCKKFQGIHIPREQIDEIVSAGLNAPSGMNRQSPRLVVVQDEATVALLSGLNAAVMGAATDPFYGAKDVIIVLAKKEGTYVYDGSLAMGNLLNAAWSMGIGACWIHRAKEVFQSPQGQALLETWGITEEVEGIGFCVLGIPAAEKPKTAINPGRVFYI